MKKLTGILALAAAGTLVLAGCTAAEESVETPAEDIQVDTGSGTSADEVVVDVEPEGVAKLKIAPGEYNYNYSYLDSYESSAGYGMSGTMIIGEDGTCEFDGVFIDFSASVEDGAVLEPTLSVARSADMKDALSYNPSEVDFDTYAVDEARSMLATEGLWNSTFNDQFLGIGFASVGNYAGPCFFNNLYTMLEPSDVFSDSQLDMEAWTIKSDAIKDYENERLAEVADIMFGLEDDAEGLTAAWLDTRPKFADYLGDNDAVYVTLEFEGQKQTGADIIVNLNSKVNEGGTAAMTWTPVDDTENVSWNVSLPTVTTPYTLGNYGADLAAELRG